MRTVLREAVALPATELAPCSEDVVMGLGIVLEHMASLASKPEVLTCFHCIRPPSVSIRDYLARIRRHFDCSIECYVLGLVYIDRIIKRHPNITISQLSNHRLLICSMMLATKFQDDLFHSNAYYAKVGGLPMEEFNKLETKMVQLLDYKLYISSKEFEMYHSILSKAAATAAA